MEGSTKPKRQRIALVANARDYLGPALARDLARLGHDLVLGDPDAALVGELESLGSQVRVVEGVHDLGRPESATKLVTAALDRFGRIDAAAAFSGVIITGRLIDSTLEQLHKLERGLLDAPYLFLKAVLPPMIVQGEGQVLVITSSSGARTLPSASLYSSLRAGATHMVRNTAKEVAPHGVQVNALGTNFMDFPGFLAATGATDPQVRARLEKEVPMGRLGRLEECAALCTAYLDGRCRFVTGQFVAHDGGWST